MSDKYSKYSKFFETKKKDDSVDRDNLTVESLINRNRYSAKAKPLVVNPRFTGGAMRRLYNTDIYDSYSQNVNNPR